MEEGKTSNKNQADSEANEKLAEFIKINSPFVDKNISHENFIAGIKSRDFKVNVVEDAYELCARKDKNVLAIIKMICFLIPPICVIVFSIYFNNWWLLLGIISWYLATIITHQYGYRFLVLVILISIGYWIKQGFHVQDYFTFFSLTFIITAILSAIEAEYEIIFATNSLVNDKMLFRKALDENKIVIERKTK